MARVETKLEVVHTDITELKNLVKEHIEKHEQIHKELDTKYASKKIETTIYWLVGVVVVALVGAGINWLFN